MITRGDIQKRFSEHRQDGDKPALRAHIQELFRTFAGELVDNTPDGREQALMMTNLETAYFWAAEAIGRAPA